MTCDICQHDPEAKIAWGCDKPTQEAVWEDGENLYFNCPIRFIPAAVYNWYSHHAYNETYGIAERYTEQSGLYIEALWEYKKWFKYYTEIQMERNKSKGKR